MNFSDKAVLFLATGFHIGNIPPAPGTFGSLIGLPLCFLLAQVNLAIAMASAFLFIGLAVWIAHRAAKCLRQKDPGCIVIDEIAGMAVAFIGLPFNPTTAVTGFVIFRTLDILKPFPIRMLDRRLSGGLGIVADDVVAGLFTNLIIRIFIYISSIL